MNATAPTGTRNLAPAHIAGNGWFPTLVATGVAANHSLYVNEDGSEAVYIHSPEGGPSHLIEAWANREQELPSWSFPTRDSAFRLTAQVAAERWVHLQAANEVCRELDIPEMTA